MNQHKNNLYFTKNPIFWNVLLSDLSDQFLTSKGDDMCRKIVKEEYFTFVRLEMLKNSQHGARLLAMLYKFRCHSTDNFSQSDYLMQVVDKNSHA